MVEEEENGVFSAHSGSDQMTNGLMSHDGDTRSGKIKSIHCTNFMCHDNFRIEFCPRINFITGQNGSGKSAIIAALQTCLGMTASQTSRGKNLADLIKHGSREDACVTVTLFNDGGSRKYLVCQRDDTDASSDSALDLYGSAIVIRRIIKRSGGSVFEIKNFDTNEVVSRQKRDVDDIVSHFRICLSNPCCVLDQETSKTFLRGNGRDKYKVFMKATYLLELDQLYESERSHREMTAGKFSDTQTKILAEKKKKLDKKKRTLEELNHVYELSKRLSEYQRCKAWLYVARAESDLDEHVKLLEKIRMKLASKKDELDEIDHRLRNIESETKSREESVAGKQKIHSEVEEKLKKCCAERDQRKAQKRSIDKALRHCDRKIDHCKSQSREATQKLEKFLEKQARLDKTHRERHLRRKEGLVRIEEQLKELKDSQLSAETERQQQEAELTNIEEEVRIAAEESRRLEQEKSIAKQQLADLKQTVHDVNARFGKDVTAILGEISRQTRSFSRPPIHIGLNVDIIKDHIDWWRPVEGQLKQQLHCFLLNSRADISTFAAMCKRINVAVPGTICIGNFSGKRFQTKLRRPDYGDGVLVMEDILQMENANVFNALVDVCGIDTIALVRTSKEARAFAFGQTAYGAKSMPKGIKRVMDMDGNTFSLRNGAEYKQSVDQIRNVSRYFGKASVASEINVFEQRCREINNAHEESQANLQKKRLREKEYQREDRRFSDRLDDIRNRIHNLKEKRHKLENEEYQESDSRGLVEKESIENHIKELGDQLKIEESRRDDLRRDISGLEEQISLYERDVEELEKSLQNLAEEARRELEAFEAFESTNRNHIVAQTALKSRIEKLSVDMNSLQKKRDELKSKAERSRQSALDYCDGEVMDTSGQSLREINAHIEHTKQAIAKEEHRFQDNETASILISRTKNEIELLKKELEALYSAYQVGRKRFRAFRKSHDTRVGNFAHHRKTCQVRMDRLFSYFLSRRHHDGKLKFDDKNETLELYWKKVDSNYTQEGEDENIDFSAENRSAYAVDTGSLSGGEKSFTQLSFLVALGELVDCPFRVMDEFDVFMDESNRSTSIAMLVHMAREEKARGKQFIFVTPHNISQIPAGQDIKKFKIVPSSDDYGQSQGRHPIHSENGIFSPFSQT